MFILHHRKRPPGSLSDSFLWFGDQSDSFDALTSGHPENGKNFIPAQQGRRYATRHTCGADQSLQKESEQGSFPVLLAFLVLSASAIIRPYSSARDNHRRNLAGTP